MRPLYSRSRAASVPPARHRRDAPAQVELVGIKDRTKGSGESDRERLAQLRAEREAAAAEAKAKKEALKAASADKQNALKEKLANKGKKGKGGGKKAWAPKAPKEKKSPKAKGKKTPTA